MTETTWKSFPLLEITRTTKNEKTFRSTRRRVMNSNATSGMTACAVQLVTLLASACANKDYTTTCQETTILPNWPTTRPEFDYSEFDVARKDQLHQMCKAFLEKVKKFHTVLDRSIQKAQQSSFMTEDASEDKEELLNSLERLISEMDPCNLETTLHAFDGCGWEF